MKRYIGMLLALEILSSCGGGGNGGDGMTTPPPPPGPSPVATVQVTLGQSSLAVGSQTQATASLRDAGGAVLSGRSIAWTSSSPTVASVGSNGQVTALSVGTTTITATSEGKSGSAALAVIQAPVQSVTLSAGTTSLTPGLSVQVTATLKDAGGHPLTGRSVSWTSSNTTVATVDNTGLVIANAPGSTVITGTSEGKSGAVTITVAPPSVAEVQVSPGNVALSPTQTILLDAVVRDGGGTVLTDRAVNWTTSNLAVATVSGTGLVVGVAAGSATITATADGVTGTAQIVVSNVGVASVALNETDFSMPVGESRVLIATARDINSNPLTGRPVTWTSSDLNVVNGYTFGDTAVVTGLKVGSATVTATVEGVSRSILVSIVAPPSPNVCTQIAGAIIIAHDGQYLGRLTNQFDSQSAFNQYGIYGSPYNAYSTNNQYGPYGSPYSSLSARNPYTSTPPVLYKNNVAIAYYTTNTFLTPRVNPAFAATCNFP